MSFLDRIKGNARSTRDAGTAPLPAGEVPDIEIGEGVEATVRLNPGAVMARHERADLAGESRLDSRLEGRPSEYRDTAHSMLDEDPQRDGPDTQFGVDFPDTRLPANAAAATAAEPGGEGLLARLPFGGQRLMLGLFLAGLALLLVTTLVALIGGERSARQVGALGQAQTQSQRLAKAIAQATIGQAAAFPEVRESLESLTGTVRSLKTGEGSVPAAPAAMQDTIDRLMPLVDRTEKNAGMVLNQQALLTQAGQALRTISRKSADLLEAADTVVALSLQSGASAAEVSQAGQLVMLTQRIGKSANELLTGEGVNSEAAFLLGKDLTSFKDAGQALLNGNGDLKLPGVRDAQVREKLQALMQQFEQVRTDAGSILGNLQGLVAAREAQVTVVNDSEPLRRGLDGLQQELTGAGGFGFGRWLAGLLGLALMVGGGWGLLRLFVADQTSRSRVAEQQRREAERQEQEAKRVNDANQAAILRLMNELQTVAEGDLTQQATVTEDITGAIADSVNYTVEELRTLVSQVQAAVARVTDTTQQVENTSTELLAASTEQLREIRETGESVLQMAGRINDVSAQAQHSAQVARQSLRASESGLQAVQNSIGGMNSIRDQIQETSKRIKRLGESSQEIGEITELISDITEQTNVLALNAAIQAASAGEAGRGFSVVAEEVQRLAERSGDATRQIAAIVRAIQTDTQDAVGAMERSTQGVVEGARLSDAAGAALADIDRVTRELAELIERISSDASREADSANVVASNIQHIFAVTEQATDGTRSTAQIVRELSRTADELRASVARFKVA